MAKIKEKEIAKKFFVELGKSQKECAEAVGVTEKTIGDWVKDGHWKAERAAFINNTDNRAEKFKAVLEDLADRQIMISQQIKDAEANGDFSMAAALKKEAAQVADQVGKFQKALEKLEKDFKVSLGTYLDVMADVFNAMQIYDKELFLKSIDFQKSHAQSIAQKLG